MNAGLIIAIISGWLLGGVVNYLGDVLPHRRRLVRPFCLNCQAEQSSWWFGLWPANCQSCGMRRSWRAWVVHVAGAGVAAFLWINQSFSLPFWLNLLVWAYFGLVIVIDLEHRLILHVTSWAGAALGLVVGIWLHGVTTTLLGGAAGYGLMLGLYWLGNVFVRFMSRRRKLGENDAPIEDALGYGDVNLAGVVGLMLGWPGVLAGLVVAILLGGAVSLLYLVAAIALRRYRAFAAIPYGPFLAFASLYLLYFS